MWSLLPLAEFHWCCCPSTNVLNLLGSICVSSGFFSGHHQCTSSGGLVEGVWDTGKLGKSVEHSKKLVIKFV